MRQGIPEITVGDVLVSPFVGYALVALALLMIVRLLLGLVGFRGSANLPPILGLSLYLLVLALLILL